MTQGWPVPLDFDPFLAAHYDAVAEVVAQVGGEDRKLLARVVMRARVDADGLDSPARVLTFCRVTAMSIRSACGVDAVEVSLAAALAGLDPQQRTALEFRAAGEPDATIAARLGVPVGQVDALVKGARAAASAAYHGR